METKDPPFYKGVPIKLTGELANAPCAGSGTIFLEKETVVPLAEFNDALDTQSFHFWPMLTSEGVKWFYTYKQHELPDWFIKFNKIEEIP